METIKKIKVEQFQGVKDQFLIKTPEGIYFQSYNAIIAFKPYNSSVVYLDDYYWDYSKTTEKYRNIFLGENKAVTVKKIKNGDYKLVNLNKQ